MQTVIGQNSIDAIGQIFGGKCRIIAEKEIAFQTHLMSFFDLSVFQFSGEKLHFAAEEAAMESVMDAIRAVRNRRAELNSGAMRLTAFRFLSLKVSAGRISDSAAFQRVACAESISKVWR